jgi:steroid delta-isomerase-like uncharacterized protein
MKVRLERRKRRLLAGVRLFMAVIVIGGAGRALQRWRARRAEATSERRDAMAGANKDLARRVIEEVFNQGKLEVADELIAEGSISHDPALPEPAIGPEGLKQTVDGYRTAFPDLRVTIEDQIAEGDRVVTRWSARGTHEGDLWGLAPTGKEGTVTGITIDRMEGGKIVESWTNWDTLGLMQQLGIVPAVVAA